MENGKAVPQNVKIELPSDLAVPSLGVDPGAMNTQGPTKTCTGAVKEAF